MTSRTVPDLVRLVDGEPYVVLVVRPSELTTQRLFVVMAREDTRRCWMASWSRSTATETEIDQLLEQIRESVVAARQSSERWEASNLKYVYRDGWETWGTGRASDIGHQVDALLLGVLGGEDE